MYIFADSGSTKTDWIITSNEAKIINVFKTIGLNPYFVTHERIIENINNSFPKNNIPAKIEKVFFYGSGCADVDNHKHLRTALQTYFFNAEINIFSDILGTARATFKNSEGIATIIGTGTNSCLYNGNIIVQNAISLGYILGDEGSGAYIGKKFAKLYLEQKFDKSLNEKIKTETGADITTILSAVYSEKHPNRFLASFCTFIKENIQHQQLKDLIANAFDNFFEKYIIIYKNYQNYPIGFCGGVALNFKEQLVESAKKYDVKDIIFLDNPIMKLIEYHLAVKFT